MAQMSPFEKEVANLIVDSLCLEDVNAGEIDPAAPLFNGGLCLDSIDALELALAIKQTYGVQIRSHDEENIRIFSSLTALSEYIQANREDG